MTHEERLARHAAGLQWDDIPGEAREAVSTLLIDTAGVILAGLKSEECRNLLARHVAWGGAEESSVAGSPRRLPAPSAAFVGGVMAHWWEWDDTHDDSAVHASAVIFPTLLAVAEAAGLDEGETAGREF
ncbi:MAG: MmgE/PrpD family protein, partial [Rhodobacteraceae bacterium]|nr:MmgE/PrpD family protein [Paracoccaceae bacterium]